MKDPSLAARALGVRQKQIVVTCNYPARARCLGASLREVARKPARHRSEDMLLLTRNLLPNHSYSENTSLEQSKA